MSCSTLSLEMLTQLARCFRVAFPFVHPYCADPLPEPSGCGSKPNSFREYSSRQEIPANDHSFFCDATQTPLPQMEHMDPPLLTTIVCDSVSYIHTLRRFSFIENGQV
ncbi:hypothetical protein CEXT_747951 [Caerostris extrusa]|uniref:Uncharacterized protein n=1 Tax=Caerostris extrusa TaxID=172846 RepID=A0AAV4T8K0_CAEEX|nr:hypothetical protein CEXT_747951 [Caerostris extrusa]